MVVGGVSVHLKSRWKLGVLPSARRFIQLPIQITSRALRQDSPPEFSLLHLYLLLKAGQKSGIPL